MRTHPDIGLVIADLLQLVRLQRANRLAIFNADLLLHYKPSTLAYHRPLWSRYIRDILEPHNSREHRQTLLQISSMAHSPPVSQDETPCGLISCLSRARQV